MDYQYKTIRGTKYYNRYQYSKTYCSYVHLNQILQIKFFASNKIYSNLTYELILSNLLT
jgi:hypothetical protein